MRYVKALAPAKVNLALRVGAVRADGFHPLDTVFEALDIYEELEVWSDSSGVVALEYAASGLGFGLPVDESNLAIRAALALRECAGQGAAAFGARMKITKRIPIAGGMAGGSADAAVALVALNALWELGFTAAQLLAIGAELGSDVPFALLGGIARGISRGEILEPVPYNPAVGEHGFLMLTNPQGLSTPAVFSEFDRLRGGARPEEKAEPASTAALCDTLEAGDMRAVAENMVNDLETPAFSLRPDLQEIVAQLREMRLGEVVILSGSGPTIAVMCKTEQLAVTARALREHFPQLGVVEARGPVPGARVIETL